MEIRVRITKKHLYLMTLLTALILGGVAVVAFGGSSPSVMGHSAGELIVNSVSIVDGSVTSADILDDTITDTDILTNSLSGHNAGAGRINEGTLDCGDITNNGGGSGLCDGTDNTGISSCSRLSGSPSATCGGGERLTGGDCSCSAGGVPSSAYSTPAGNFGGGVTCSCSAGTPAAEVFCCN